MTIWEEWAKNPNWDTVKNSVGYLTATPQYIQKVQDILRKYGIDPGHQAGTADSDMDFSNDPYSVVAMLKRTQDESNHSTINAANAAGLEESGAAVSGLNANTEDYKKGYQGALAAEGGELSTALGDYSDKVTGFFDDAEKAAVPVPPTPTEQLTGGGGGGVGTGYTGSGSTLTGTSDYSSPAGANPWHIPGANGAALTVTQKLKPALIRGGHAVAPARGGHAL